MAVSKRTRYEVLKRDNFTCRYCRSTEGELKVDHVNPKALGGSDDPSNLVAACHDCNAGKSSTAPDAALVADVREDALRHAELTRQAYAVLVERLGQREEYIDEWGDHWTTTGLPADWRNTIGRWFEMGVPVELVTSAADIACSRTNVADSGRFAYMCGIVWSQVSAIDEMAEMRRHIDGAFMSHDVLVEERIESWRHGYASAVHRERLAVARADHLSLVVDHINYPDDPQAVGS